MERPNDSIHYFWLIIFLILTIAKIAKVPFKDKIFI